MSNWMKDEVMNPDGTYQQGCKYCGEYIEDVAELASYYLCDICEETT